MESLYIDFNEGTRMERITISIDTALAAEFDQLIAARGYKNRSEAVRDLVRSHLEAQRQVLPASGYCVANLSYVYNHHERDLAERLTALQHDQHDLTVATMHAHLDHNNCMESVILRGATAAVRGFSDALMAESGVRHGQINIVTVEVDGPHAHSHSHSHAHPHIHSMTARHAAKSAATANPHTHLKPKT
jgi:CopG family nickel-responsive transcriptional regulator